MLFRSNLANGVQDNTPNAAFWEKAALSATTLPLLAFYMSAVGIDPTIAGFAVLLTLHNLERSLEDLFNPHVTAAQAEQTFGTNVSNIMIQDVGIILPTWINQNSFQHVVVRETIMCVLVVVYATVIHRLGKPVTACARWVRARCMRTGERKAWWRA